MSIVLRGAPAVASSITAGASVTLTLPPMAAGDIALLFTCSSYSVSASDPVVTSAGWTDCGKGRVLNSAGNLATRCYYKVMSASDPNVVVAPGANSVGVAAIVTVFYGVDLIALFQAVQTALGTSTTPDPAAVTPNKNGACIVAVGMAPVSSVATKGIVGYTSPTPNVADANASRPCTLDLAYLIDADGVGNGVVHDPGAFASFGVSSAWVTYTFPLVAAQRSTALGGGPPSAPGNYLRVGDTTSYLTDYGGNKWWLDQTNHTIVNGAWAAGGSASLMLAAGVTPVTPAGYIWANTAPNWWFYDYGVGWNYQATAGPESPQGFHIVGGSQVCIVDDAGNVWDNTHFNSGAYYDIYKNGVAVAGGVADGGITYGYSPTGSGKAVWGYAAPNWYWFRNSDSTWQSTGASGPNLLLSAAPLTVGSPRFLDPNSSNPRLAQPLNNQAPTPFGVSLIKGDTAHSIIQNPALNIWQFDAAGSMFINGYLTSGVTFGAGDLIEGGTTGNVIGSNVWARISGVWYYFRGADLTFYVWNGGPNPQPTNGPALTFPTATGITATSPQFTAATAKAISNFVVPTPWSVGSPTFTAATPKAISNFVVPPWSVGSPALDVAALGKIVATANFTTTSPLFTPTALGKIVAAQNFTTGSPAFATVTPKAISNFVVPNFATTSPLFTAPTVAVIPNLAAAALAVGSPLFTAASPKAISNFIIPAWAIASPTFTAPVSTVIPNAAATVLAVGSPAFTAPALTRIPNAAAPAFAVGSPAFTAASLAVIVNAGAGILAVGSPAFTLPVMVPVANAVTPGLAVGVPAIGAATFNQAAAFAVPAFAPASPAIGKPVAYGWVPLSLAVGAPAFGAQVIKQTHALIIQNWNTGSPDINGTAPNMSGATVIGVITLVPASPAFGAVAFGQRHELSAAFAVASPELGAPVFNRIANATASSFSVGSPNFLAPLFNQIVGFSVSFTVGLPSIGVPGFGRNLAATNLTPGALSLGTAPLGQVHLIGCTPLTVLPPTIGAASGGYVLAATAPAVAALSIGIPGFAQNYRFAAAAPLTSGALAIGVPFGGYNFAAPFFGMAAPTIDPSTLVRVIAIAASNLVVGSPASGAPIGGSNYAAIALAVASPAIGSATFNQAAALAVPPPVVSSPVIGLPTAYGWRPLTLAPASPVFGAQVIKQTHALAILPWDIDSPDINGNAPNMFGGAAIGAVELLLGRPAFPVVGLSQRHGLATAPTAVAGPALDAAVLGVVVRGVAPSLTTGNPAIDVPAMVRVVGTAAPALTVGQPTIGTALAGAIARGTPLPLTVQRLEFGAPAATLYNNFVPFAFGVAGPSIPAVNLNITVALAAPAKAVASPVLDHPTMGAIAGGDPIPLTTAAPTIAVATLTVNAVPIGATGIAVGDPILPEPSVVAVAGLRPENFPTGRPEVGKVPPQLGLNITIDPAELVIGPPQIGQQWLVIHGEAASFEVGSPELRKPTLAQSNRLFAVGVASDHPDLGVAGLGQFYPLVARGITVAPPDQYWPELAAAIPLAISNPTLGQPSLVQLTIRPTPVGITGVVTHPGIVGVEDPSTEATGTVAGVPAVTGRMPSTKRVTGQPASARITGVAEFTKIKS